MNKPLTPVLPGTIALVLCGGQSSRMGTDKSMLVYYDKPQRYYLYELVQPFCEHVYISCRHSQAKSVAAGYHCITDDHRYNNTGPVAALLTAFEKFPGKDILLIGCDYPFLNSEELKQFCNTIQENKPAAFYNEDAGIPEPLLAWYPYTSYKALKENFRQGQLSLKHFLQGSGTLKYIPANKQSIRSVDTEEDFREAIRKIVNGS